MTAPCSSSGAEGIGAEQALTEIEKMTEEIKLGRIYTGKVVRIESYGAFVEIAPGQDGMVHISQLADYRVPSVEEVVQLGDEITVMSDGHRSVRQDRLSRQAVMEGWSSKKRASVTAAPAAGRAASPAHAAAATAAAADFNDRSGDRGRPRR